jgi:hypothetical protein
MRVAHLGLLAVLPLAFAGGALVSADTFTVTGGGPAKSDCYVGFSVVPDRKPIVKGTTLTESACGGSCTFQVQACSGLTTPTICKAPATLTKATPTGGLAQPPLTSAGCGSALAVTLTPKGRKAAKKKFALKASASGVKPPKDNDKLTLVCAGNSTTCTPNTTTTTTLPDPCRPAGSRVFQIGDASHVYAGLLGPDQPADLAGAGTRTGSLVLLKGTPDSNGVASLTLSCDAIIGITVVDGSYACLKLEAAASSGKIDCDGGTPVDVTVTGNSHEDTDGHNDSPAVQIEQGSPGPAGSAYLIANGRFVNCADDGSHDGLAGGCLAPFTNGSADCSDPTKVDFSKAKLILAGGVSTTGTATTTIANPKGTAPAIVKTGTPFSCDAFTTPGQGVLETPAMFYDFPLLSGDVTAMLQIGE